ncbi:ATP-binding protein [Tepidibacter sp. Z1-5]
MLDRLLHHSYLFNIAGPSYRIKDKLKYKSKKSEEYKCQV